MPRELTLQSGRQEAAGRQMEITVKDRERTVWVSLSGILDQTGVDTLIGRVAPRLAGRGYRIVLDGSRLGHIDYRCTATLVKWNRKLRQFDHQLFLQDWSDYLKAILCMEDWDRELAGRSAHTSSLRLLQVAQADQMP